MGPFALPVPAYKQQRHKRKRQDDAAQEATASFDDGTIRSSVSPFTSDSINPRSHGPHTLRQLAVAGLSPEDELPSKFYPNFPHSPLPSEAILGLGGRRRRRSRTRTSSVTTSGSEADVDTDASESQAPRNEDPSVSASHFSARMKHLSTLTTIMHRCLHEGDIARAKRAFHLLIRSRDVDLRLNELWTIGTEILMRDGETARDDQRQGASDQEGEDETEAEPPRWGSASNVDKVTQYLDYLIHQYPFDWNRPLAIGAVDFYLALFSIEIYNIDAEFRRALWHVDRDFDFEPAPTQDDRYDASGEEMDYEAQSQRERRWAAKDEIRQQTQHLARDVAARMDQRMDVGPYAQCLELLRLRGMLAMFIGDLYLSARFVERSGLEDQMKGLSLREGGLGKRSDDPDDRVAIGRRDEEFAKARGFFQRIPANGGELEPWIKNFVEDDGEDEEMSSMLA